jgi:hypothetical protein
MLQNSETWSIQNELKCGIFSKIFLLHLMNFDARALKKALFNILVDATGQFSEVGVERQMLDWRISTLEIRFVKRLNGNAVDAFACSAMLASADMYQNSRQRKIIETDHLNFFH